MGNGACLPTVGVRMATVGELDEGFPWPGGPNLGQRGAMGRRRQPIYEAEEARAVVSLAGPSPFDPSSLPGVSAGSAAMADRSRDLSRWT